MPTLEETKNDGMRIAKFLAHRGVASRREIERLLADGKIICNGEILTNPATHVSDADEISVSGKKIAAKEHSRLWIFHKPKGCITTHHDPQSRTRVFDLLPSGMPRVVSVGRLDYNSEGLLLLTNDPNIAHHLEHPKNAWKRRYRVRAYGKWNKAAMDNLAHAKHSDDTKILYQAFTYEYERQQGENHWISMTLTEGKNREIRNLLESINLEVNRLIRVSYGPFHLGNLPTKSIKEVPQKNLRELLGSIHNAAEKKKPCSES
jgi:23S rRNA pseudouridine2605 synthase